MAGHVIEGDEEFCRQVFLAAVGVARKTGPFAVSEDRMVMLSPSSEIFIDVVGGFKAEVDHAAAFQKLARPVRSVARVGGW